MNDVKEDECAEHRYKQLKNAAKFLVFMDFEKIIWIRSV